MSGSSNAAKSASMTKEQLKSALVQAGVPVPPGSAKKEEFQKLYNERVLPLHSNSEFSSDDEQESNSQQNGNSGTGNHRKSYSKFSPEFSKKIEEYSNEQLYSLCLEVLGSDNVGPVLNSTRHLYESLLYAKLGDGPIGPKFNSRQSENGDNTSYTGANGFSDSDDEAAVETASRASRSSRGSNTTPIPTIRISSGIPNLKIPVVTITSKESQQSTRSQRRSETPRNRVISSPAGVTSTTVTEEQSTSFGTVHRTDTSSFSKGDYTSKPKTVTGVSYFKERPGYSSATTSNVLPRKPTVNFPPATTVLPKCSSDYQGEPEGPIRTTALWISLMLAVALGIVMFYFYQQSTKHEQIQDELDEILQTMEEQP